MKTHLLVTNGVLGLTMMMTGVGYASSDYLHLVRHRDSQGNLLARPTQHEPKTDVLQKTVAPAQPKTFEERAKENQGSANWGASIADVKANETVPPAWEVQSPILEHHEYRVGYHTQIESIDTSLIYTFFDDKLGQATYVFEPNHEDAVNYVQDFRTVKNWIMQKYGEPTSSQEIWLDNLYAYDESLWGQAVLRGHLVMMAEWKYPESEVVLVLDGGDDTVGLVADFTSTQVSVPVSLKEPMVEDVSSDNQVYIDPLTEESSSQLEDSSQEGQVDSMNLEETAHAPTPMPMEEGSTGSLAHPGDGVVQEDVGVVDSGIPSNPMNLEQHLEEVPAHAEDGVAQEDVSAVDSGIPSNPMNLEQHLEEVPAHAEDGVVQKDVSAVDSGIPSNPMNLEQHLEEVPAHAEDGVAQEDVSAVDPGMTSETMIMEEQPVDMSVPTEAEPSQAEEVSALDSVNHKNLSGGEEHSEIEGQLVEESLGDDSVNNVDLESEETPLSL